MAASARVQTHVLAKERSLFVNKGSVGTPNWVLVGCASGKEYGFSNEMAKLNCDSGLRNVDNGEDSVFDFNLNGFVFQYASGDIATNVSAAEFEAWGTTKPQVRRQFKYEGKYIGDQIRTFFGYIASFRETATNGEVATYAIALQIDETPVVTTQA